MSRVGWRRVVPSLPTWWLWLPVWTGRTVTWVPAPIRRRLGRDAALALARAAERVG